jgi:hypothetical protein
MQILRDKIGRDWKVEITVQTVRQVRALLKVDLNELLAAILNQETQPLLDVLSDPVKLVDLTYCICKEQADELGVTDEHFGRGWAGDFLEAAGDALIAELVFFSPSPQVRALLATLVNRAKDLVSLQLTRAQKGLAELDLERLLESLPKRSKPASGNGPASLDLTPLDLPSGN